MTIICIYSVFTNHINIIFNDFGKGKPKKCFLRDLTILSGGGGVELFVVYIFIFFFLWGGGGGGEPFFR